MNINQPLHQRAVSLARQYRRLEGQLVEVLQRIDSKKVYLKLGYGSMFDYCRLALFLTESQSYSFIRVARKSIEVPELKKAVIGGEISVSSAKTISAVIDTRNASEWISKAKSLNKQNLEREVVKENPKALCQEQIRPVAHHKNEMKLVISDALESKLRRVQDLECKRTGRAINLEETLESLAELYLRKKDPTLCAKRAKDKHPPPPSATPGPSQLFPGTVGRKLPAQITHQVVKRDESRCREILPGGRRCNNSRWTEIHHRHPFALGGKHSSLRRSRRRLKQSRETRRDCFASLAMTGLRSQ